MGLFSSVRNSVRIWLESGLISVRGHCAKKVYVCIGQTHNPNKNYKR